MGPDGREGSDQGGFGASGRGVPARGREATIAPEGEHIPFNRPYATGAEYGYIRQAIANAHVSGNGPFTRRCTKLLEDEIGSERVLMTHSCTGALEMAMLLAEIELDDEVIVPSFAFPSLPNAIALRGGVPVFVDVRADTLNLDERLVEGAITERTRAIAPIDYAGVGCEMESFQALARAHGMVVIEDAAQGYGACYRERPLGSLADLACLSFHETKNVTCGEGGALLINRPEWVERAEVIQEKGTNRSKFFRGEVDKYTWVDLGSSYLASDIGAAFLWAQLEQAREIRARRIAIWDTYHEALEALEEEGLLRRPVVPDHCSHSAHVYYVLLAGDSDRDRFIQRLAEDGVNATFHYVPLHSSPAGLHYGRVSGSMEITDDVSERLVRLPLWVEMGESHVARVVAAVRRALEAIE
jgi:dTDP-4-amino-4,6-dideoxygalactose transaminase